MAILGEVLGRFRAVTVQDGASQERDGEPYVAINRLWTRDDRELWEVQFTDGIWMLAQREDIDTDRELP